jgi:hypothetical protein
MLNAFVFVPFAYLQGLWFLFAHPHTFLKFTREYKRFQYRIEQNDEIEASGFYHLNRKQRRMLERGVK